MPFQQWNGTGTQRAATVPSTEFFRSTNGGFFLRFAGVADFIVDRGAENVVFYASEASGDGWMGVYEHQVQPLLLSLRGAQVFHGAAISVGDVAIAFMGASGRGKSTLTTGFAQRGYSFLGDDCLHLELSMQQVYVHPQANHVRLWEDSADALASGAAGYVPGSSKPRLTASERLPHCDRALPLSRVYLLGEENVGEPVISAVSPSQQLIGWTTNAFVLDIKNPDVLKRNLAAAARLVREVPMRRLEYPRRYELLDEVVDAVLADVAA